MFTRKGYATSVSGKTANGCPVRSAKPPDKMDFYFISPCGAKLCEAFPQLYHARSGVKGSAMEQYVRSSPLTSISCTLSTSLRPQSVAATL